MLLQSHAFIEYVDDVLLDERASLNNFYIFSFLQVFLPKVRRFLFACSPSVTVSLL